MDYNFETVCFVLVSLSAGIHQLRRYMIHSSLMHSFVFKLAGIFEIWTATRGNERKVAEMSSWILYTFTFQANWFFSKIACLQICWNSSEILDGDVSDYITLIDVLTILVHPNWYSEYWLVSFLDITTQILLHSALVLLNSTLLYHSSTQLYLTLPWL